MIDSTHNQSLFLAVMGTPFQSELTTSVFRMTEEALHQGIHVTVWTCGYATGLTQTTLTRLEDPLGKPDNCNHSVYTTASLVQAFFRRYEAQLRWYVCKYCMEERGASSQIPEVEIQIPFSFNTYLNMADKALVLGVKS